ncbi:GumC domain-containing protein [Microscilla marina]|uniref:Chain length determinant protein n=1 Tax=Microscilla marina ATCC 23134 TaxID=313606 RepID=A1ZMX4_MICM2|nr:hypothetical protein [Microscilla marina]EAY28155.1 hypothetical protein M23134_03416 [Microscilla marina ATCC 23134]
MSQSKSKPEEEKNAAKPITNLNEQTKKVVQSDEIDLRELWGQFVSFLRVVIKGIIKRGLLLAVFLGIGGGVGFYFHKVSAPTYKTRMLIDAKEADYSILSGLLGTLQNLADEGNHKALTNILKIDPAIAKTIVSIKAVDKLVVLKDLSAQQNKELKPGKDERQASSKERDKEIFQLKDKKFAIELSLTDNANVTALEGAIITYLQENEYMKKRVNTKKMFLTQKKEKLRQEIQELDSLKRHIAKVFTRKDQNIQITDPGTISKLYEEAVKLREEELKVDTTLALIDNVQIVEGFVKFNNPSIKVTKRIKTGLYIGFAIWFLLVLWLDVRKPFMKFLNSEPKNSD